MKKFLLLLFLSFSFFSQGQTSVYHPFPDSNAVWNCQFRGYICSMSPPYGETCSYIISGDTMINSISYHKLEIPFVHRYGPLSSCQHYYMGYKGAIRQDTAARKVFFVPKNQINEELLYDFTLQVGDSISFYNIGWANTHITSIDSILIGSDYRKRWHLSDTNNIRIFSFIEGIGSTAGLQDWYCDSGSSCYLPMIYELQCFSQNGIKLYPTTTGTCGVVSTNDISKEQPSIIISPNPAHSQINVECKMQNGELKMYDVMGRVVMEEKIHSPFSTFNFQLSGGVYFLRVGDGEKMAVQKLIIE